MCSFIMTYVILNVSDSDKHRASAIGEYTKRLGKSVLIENLKPCKNGIREQIIQNETEEILEKLGKKYRDWIYVLMSKDGELVNTEKFFDICKNKNIVFIIGGPYGLNENELLKIGAKRVAFGKITLPHGLAKLTLLEQIYRIGTIESGKSYHY